MTRTSQFRHIRPSPLQQILLSPIKPHPLTSIITEQPRIRVIKTSNSSLLSTACTWLTDSPTTSTKLESNSMVSKGATTPLGWTWRSRRMTATETVLRVETDNRETLLKTLMPMANQPRIIIPMVADPASLSSMLRRRKKFCKRIF